MSETYTQHPDEPENIVEPDQPDMYWRDMWEFISGQQGDDD